MGLLKQSTFQLCLVFVGCGYVLITGGSARGFWPQRLPRMLQLGNQRSGLGVCASRNPFFQVQFVAVRKRYN